MAEPSSFRVNGIWAGGNVAGSITLTDTTSTWGWSDIYLARNAAGVLGVYKDGTHGFGIDASADGIARLTDRAGTSFTRLILGTNDASGIALSKNGTTMELKLGNASAFASVNGGQYRAVSALVVADSGFKSASGTYLMQTTSAWTDGAGVATGTLTNAPSAGNPTKWIAVDDNGTTRKIPAW
jgi:hypothetical protein